MTGILTVAQLVVGRVVHSVLTVADPLGPTDQDPDQVREQTCSLVASDRTCRPVEPEPPRSSGGGPDVFGVLLWMLLGAGLIALLFLLARALMARTGWGSGRVRPAAGDSDPADADLGAVAIDRTREPIDWRAEADDHRRHGRFREALRCRYRALVGDLARRGLIDEIPGRTTGEERVQVREVVAAAHPDFAAAADLFDDAWYGHADVGDSDVDAFEQLEAAVLFNTSRAPKRQVSQR